MEISIHNTKNKWRKILPLVLLSYNLLLGQQISFYVASDGKDSNVGTLKEPFATIEKALQSTNSSNGHKSTTIYLRKGVYSIKKSLLLNKEITQNNAITLTNYNDEAVVISGGLQLDNSNFKKITDKSVLDRLSPSAQDNIYEINLFNIGIKNFGKLQPHGFGKKIQPARMEVFFNKSPLTLARWPNTGYLPIGDVIDPGAILKKEDKDNRGARFHYDFELPHPWKDVSTIWLNGLFFTGYADENIQVENIDRTNKTIQLQQGSIYGVASSNESPKKKYRRFFFYNILEELDSPGEWFLDEISGKLYIWPPKSLLEADITVSLMESPLVILDHSKDVTIKGITFGFSRGIAIYLQSTSNVSFLNCEFLNLGTSAISTNGSSLSDKEKSQYAILSDKNDSLKNIHLIIQSCKIYNTGAGGISISGGNRRTLESGQNLVENCEIFNYSRLNYFYCPAVSLSGVGNKVKNCFIHTSLGQAITFAGNDHEIAYNHIQHVASEISDGGAVYTGRDPSATGTTIHDNFFDNIKSDYNLSVAAVYIDDGSGGIKIDHNVFYETGTSGEFGFGAIHLNGGSNNHLDNNYFIDCNRGISINSWTDENWKKNISSKAMYKKLYQDVDIRSALYQSKYPHLKMDGDTVNIAPRINYISNTLVYNVKQFINTSRNIEQQNTFIAPEDPGFESMEKKDFTLIRTPIQLQNAPGWKPVEFNKIGPYK